MHHEDPPPYNRLRGPVHARGPVSGVVWQHGLEIAAWGEPDRAELTFSVAKTYLAMLAGVAHGQGLLPDADEPVVERVPGIGFESRAQPRRSPGPCCCSRPANGKAAASACPTRWTATARSRIDPHPPSGRKGDARPLQTPGSYWEYNDVRINQLSLALLHLFGAPLPEVLREQVMRPIGASDGWAWRGYDDAWVELPAAGGRPARRVQSVPGGTHWGGGVSIGARDQARLGQLLLDGGRHGGRQVIPAAWVRAMFEPCAIAPFYGGLLWLNRDGRNFPGASARQRLHGRRRRAPDLDRAGP